jgi:hypothetical protein
MIKDNVIYLHIIKKKLFIDKLSINNYYDMILNFNLHHHLLP